MFFFDNIVHQKWTSILLVTCSYDRNLQYLTWMVSGTNLLVAQMNSATLIQNFSGSALCVVFIVSHLSEPTTVITGKWFLCETAISVEQDFYMEMSFLLPKKIT